MMIIFGFMHCFFCCIAVNFQVHYITEPSKISELPDIPQIFPHDLGTVTSFRYSISNMDHQTVRYFVKAIDFMGAEKVEQTRITFDFSKPIIHKFNLQNDDPMLEANSSSRLDMLTITTFIFSSCVFLFAYSADQNKKALYFP